MPLISEHDLRQGRYPEGFMPRAWGVARFAAGEECDYHYHDGDEYWFVLEGRFKIIEEGVEYEAGPGDCLYTPMGLQHKLIALTDAAEFWLGLELHGEKRAGHLHRES
jgi:mannose-6-phosphate isomerase-like protein (cupin superfamily)